MQTAIDFDILDIDLNTLESFERPKKVMGIYFLLLDGVVVYVGKSGSVHQRIMSHVFIHKYKPFNEYRVLEVEHEDQLNKMESNFIKKYLPEYNNCMKSQKLKRLNNGRN